MSLTASQRTRTTRRPLALAPLRRLWILPVSIVVVAAIAYAVAGLQTASYTAQSNVVVTSAPGPQAAGSSGSAASLASTYAGALPNDPTLEAYVAKTAHVNPLGTIVAQPPKGSVITLQFFSATRTGALAGARAIANGLSASKPQSSVVTPNTLTVLQDPFTATLNPASVTTSAAKISAQAAAAASGITTPSPLLPPSQTDRYMAQVVAMVPASGSGPTEGINPDDADKLATTYAGVIPVDQTLLADVGKAVHQSSSQVASNLSVINEQSTSILELTYKASNPRIATTGARTAASLLSGPNPVAAGIVPSSLQIVSLPNTVGPAATTHKGRTVAIGAVLGLILGIVLLVAWERSDPHVTDARSLSGQFGCPATPADRLSPDAAHALLERWASLTDRVPARVAILPADKGSVAQADEVARLLARSGDGVRYIDARSGALPEALTNGHLAGSRDSIALVHAAPPGQGGEAVALSCDLTVVVMRSGARNAEIRNMAEELANFGVVPTWALLTPRSGHIGTSDQRPLAGAVSA
jgi:capsular polysaccharide biosynthesis protein